jgi:beta-galactosidase
MTVPNAADTYLDTRAVHKGEAWINQHPLGRFWSIGPQSTLYVPGPWLQKGQNEIIYFDLMGTPTDALKSTTHPIFGASIAQRN